MSVNFDPTKARPYDPADRPRVGEWVKCRDSSSIQSPNQSTHIVDYARNVLDSLKGAVENLATLAGDFLTSVSKKPEHPEPHNQSTAQEYEDCIPMPPLEVKRHRYVSGVYPFNGSRIALDPTREAVSFEGISVKFNLQGSTLTLCIQDETTKANLSEITLSPHSTISIGRGNDIPMTYTRVSRQHLSIEFDGKSVFVTDTSKNGSNKVCYEV